MDRHTKYTTIPKTEFPLSDRQVGLYVYWAIDNLNTSCATMTAYEDGDNLTVGIEKFPHVDIPSSFKVKVDGRFFYAMEEVYGNIVKTSKTLGSVPVVTPFRLSEDASVVVSIAPDPPDTCEGEPDGVNIFMSFCAEDGHLGTCNIWMSCENFREIWKAVVAIPAVAKYLKMRREQDKETMQEIASMMP